MPRNPKLDHVKAKAGTRGDVHEVGWKYLSRLYPIVHHMHQVLLLHRDDESSLQVSTRQYVIALATHLETFFRDIFRYALESDSHIFDHTVRKHRLRVPSDHDLAQQGVTGYDFIAESLTLQSAESIADALDPLFVPNGFRFAVEHTQFQYAIPSKSAFGQGFPLTAFPDWWQDFTQIFNLRHEFIHDANSAAFVRPLEVGRLESLAVILPQYVTMMVGAVRLVFTVQSLGNVVPMFLVEDILATDWEVPRSDN